MKKTIGILTTITLLAGCSSVSKHSPTVQHVQQAPTVIAQPVSYTTQVSSHTSNSNQVNTAAICETSEMRAQLIDNDKLNDVVRVMVVQDSQSSSRVLSEVEVDCRDYFLRKSLAPTDAQIVRASTAPIENFEPATRTVKQNSRYTYIVQSGDTVWDIARQHCTSVKDITRLNGLGRGNVLDIGQRLKLPDTDCD